MRIAESDLIINPDGSIYHLNLLPEDVADTIITVGDPDRVAEVSKYFDRITIKKGKREFITHTGFIGSKQVTVISTGIGTDNIDIVLNELDALVNIDFTTRTVKSELKSLNIIRIGTSGAIQSDIPMDTILASTHGIGLDALMNYYPQSPIGVDDDLHRAIIEHFESLSNINPYFTAASSDLLKQFAHDLPHGITATAPGFYAPQGRMVRAKTIIPNFVSQLNSFTFKGKRITNLEMETAGIYALAQVLGHKALSINAILASRVNFLFSQNPQKIVDQAIKLILERI